jgi:hypothetical protein
LNASEITAPEANMQTITAQTDPATDPAVIALRQSVIGDGVTIEQAAAAFGVTPRCVRYTIDRHNIPYRKVFGARYISTAALRAALAPEPAPGPRKRGRPRKAAA